MERTIEILPPKLRHRFKLVVQRADGKPAPELKAIENQVLAFDIGAERLNAGDDTPMVEKFAHRTNRSVIWLEDDDMCTVMKAVRSWQANPADLRMILFLLNANSKVLEAYTFSKVRFEALQHSLWSYSPVEDHISLDVKPTREMLAMNPEIPTIAFEVTGSLYAANAKSASMKLLQVVFEDLYHSIATSPATVEEILGES